MKRPRGPVFLHRASYRQRRRRDAARLLPFVGAFLFLLPILWAPAQTFRRDTAPDGIYLFVAWAVLIGATWALTRAMARHPDPDGEDGGAED
jgi:hypothetical protein